MCRSVAPARLSGTVSRLDRTHLHVQGRLSSFGSGPPHFPEALSDVRGRARVGSGLDAAAARLQGPITLATVEAAIINLEAGAEAKQWQNVCKTMSIDLRAPVASPVLDGYRRLTSSPRVVVHHPGYLDDNTNELFALVATDGSPSAPGVQYGVVHTACAIFACNRFDGWLSATRDSWKRHAVAPQGLLPVCDYYFHIPPEDSTFNELANPTLAPSLIIPTFRFWPFPHSRSPAPWKDALVEERLAPEPAK